MTGSTKTIQLRRYRIIDGEMDAFLDWWSSHIPPLREKAGFAIEFGYADRDNNQFVWAVSVPGDREAFLRAERAYNDSDERSKIFEGVPQRVSEMVVSFVTPFA